MTLGRTLGERYHECYNCYLKANAKFLMSVPSNYNPIIYIFRFVTHLINTSNRIICQIKLIDNRLMKNVFKCVQFFIKSQSAKKSKQKESGLGTINNTKPQPYLNTKLFQK